MGCTDESLERRPEVPQRVRFCPPCPCALPRLPQTHTAPAGRAGRQSGALGSSFREGRMGWLGHSGPDRMWEELGEE